MSGLTVHPIVSYLSAIGTERRALCPGDRLPSTRKLAEKPLAYQELWALGFLEMRAGARPRVRERMQIAAPAARSEKGRIDWGGLVTPRANAIRRPAEESPGRSAGESSYSLFGGDAKLPNGDFQLIRVPRSPSEVVQLRQSPDQRRLLSSRFWCNGSDPAGRIC